MANQYGGSPPCWIVDTASATAVTTDAVTVDHIAWEGGTASAAADECKVTTNDATPIPIFDVFATGADFEASRRFPKNFHCNGLIVPTLGHGKAYIYLA